jgi:hypothetical protein
LPLISVTTVLIIPGKKTIGADFNRKLAEFM